VNVTWDKSQILLWGLSEKYHFQGLKNPPYT